jgi:dienelactone hydrolase
MVQVIKNDDQNFTFHSFCGIMPAYIMAVSPDYRSIRRCCKTVISVYDAGKGRAGRETMKSDVGNLYPFISAQADRSEFVLSYLYKDWGELEQWRSAARAKLHELLLYHPSPSAKQAAVWAVRERNGYREEEIVFHTSKDSAVRGVLLVPTSGRAPFPCVIALHDHGGFYYCGIEKLIENDSEPEPLRQFKRDIYAGRSWASELARRGYVVFVIDAFYFGSRKLDLAEVSAEMLERCPHKLEEHLAPDERIRVYNRACGFFEAIVLRHLLAAGVTWPGVMLYDDRASIDYVLSRPEVDGRRIGCCGLSLGGYRSAFLIGLDPRIRCAVVTGFMTSFGDEQWNGFRNQSFPIYVPGMHPYLDFPDVAALGVPTPLLVQNCKRDHLFSQNGMKNAETKLRRIYEKAGAPEHLSVTWHDVPHQFDEQMQREAFNWLDRWL